MPTPLRAIRIPNNLWARLKAAAKNQGTDASSLMRHLIEEHLAQEHVLEADDPAITEEEYEDIANRLDPDGDFVSPEEHAGIIEEWRFSKRGF